MINPQDTPSAGPLEAADFDDRLAAALPPARYAACTADACNQGRSKCLTPMACQITGEDDEPGRLPEGAAIAVLLVIALTLLAAAGLMMLAGTFQ